MATQLTTPIGDLRIKMFRTKSGKICARVRILTPAEIRWHSISFPPDTPAYALYEQAVQDALKRLTIRGEVVSVQCVLPV